MFQFTKRTHSSGKGDCLGGFDRIYSQFTERIAQVPAWGNIPWGLGAWGIVENERTPVEDQIWCLSGIKDNLESGNYPKIQASIYFNSITSRIDENQMPYMQDEFDNYLSSPAFFDPDFYSTLKFGSKLQHDAACEYRCPSRCYYSWVPGDFETTQASRCKGMGQVSF